ncbi:TetR family transcriptional regulator [Corynebacterium poyangense]|uniref:TetR family transcriptional regulator n=1 Tax=Corynebacterium poyangense TaxID=2684405 RepID=A0A7H0SR03_9CORY|nr:TetR family transcriptional regulator [Corynebacterium poyangense]MBZ8176398.1 TetR family transcriptional regulator [Corynebacterium poyangense]QNQ90978.1 TetR family transcriptional regulator [Corynebacterium poyangense]
MRRSKREKILESAVKIIEESGPDAVTYEALAQASGLSKSGLIYHFPSRDDLMLAIHEHLAQAWEQELLATAGVSDVAELSEAQRLKAAVICFSTAASLPELLLQIEAARNPRAAAVWNAVDQRWLPSPESIQDSATKKAAYLVKLIADGLFLHDYVHFTPLSSEQRSILTEAALKLIPPDPQD